MIGYPVSTVANMMTISLVGSIPREHWDQFDEAAIRDQVWRDYVDACERGPRTERFLYELKRLAES